MAGTTTYLGISYPTSTDYVKDGATAIQTVATGFDSAVAIPTYNAQTGTTYTFALTDVGKTVTASNASASTYTIPPTASVAWPTGTTLEITNLGAGVVTFAAGSGVTVTNTAATLAQYQSASLIRTGLNAWTVTPRSGGAAVETVLSSGTFTTASAVNLSSVLSDTYPFYTLNVYAVLASSTSVLNLRFRENTTDLVGTNYANASFYIQVTGTSGNYASNGDTGQFQLSGLTSVDTTHIVVDISRPSATRGILTWQAYDGHQNYSITGGGRNKSITNFNGLSFFPSASTITGYYILTGRKA